MEANEAPEKIYLFESPIGIIDDRWLFNRGDDVDIEYTRTDVFIEKAIGWIDYNNRNGGCYFDGWENDFKQAMKGE